MDENSENQETEVRRPPVDTYQWKDITEEFLESVEELKLGELLHFELFGLFEAMSAIEMMDRKMDIGMLDGKDRNIPLTFDTAVKNGKLKLKDLEPSEYIGLFDSLFACLISWLEGHSTVQTIFTCLYLHNTSAIEDNTLMCFCNGILKLTNVIKNFIIMANVYEEEDFQFGSYNFNLCNEFSDNKVITSLKSCENDLQKMIREVDPANSEKSEELTAVFNRIKFERLLLQSLVMLFSIKVPSEDKIDEITKLIQSANDLIPHIKKSMSLGTQPDVELNTPNIMGFSPMVNQRLLPPTFPRYTKIKDRLDAFVYLEELTYNLKHVCKVINCTNYQSALNFFMEFSKKSSCLLSRSVLQMIYLPASNKVLGASNLSDMLKESVKAFIAPPALMPKNPLYNNQQAKECIDSFFFYNGHIFVNFLRICGFNRARQRDKIARLLDNFASLQDEAERVDTYLHKQFNNGESSSGPCRTSFGTWVLYHCLRAMSLYLLSGLELELYSVHEYLYVFWYLYEFLFGWIISALTRADSFLFEHECASEQFKNLSKGQKKSKLKKKKMKPYVRECMLTQALQDVCGGYYKALAGFHKANRIPQPLTEFDHEHIRYEHRFAPFAELQTPPAIGYNDFCHQKRTLMMASQEDLFLSAAKHFHQARTILEHAPNLDDEMTEVLKIAKFNFVVMNLLANGHKKDSTLSPEFDFSLHRCFPIIKQQ